MNWASLLERGEAEEIESGKRRGGAGRNGKTKNRKSQCRELGFPEKHGSVGNGNATWQMK